MKRRIKPGIARVTVGIMLLVLLIVLLTGSGCMQHGFQALEQTTFPIQETTIAKVHEALQRGSLTCEALVNGYISRIRKYDQATRLNAIVLINPNALRRAKMLDEEFRNTRQLKALHCVPIILKDNYDTSDMPTSGGSIILKDSLPPDDAYMVRKLREAGGIILAKSNMAEWAFSPYFTISSTVGETRNAYDLERVPAGSSGGTASAVAANLGLVGMGTDTGNSIRGPASHAALVGIRSTIGATSRDGIIPLLLNRDIAGPMTRTVEDAARVFAVIAGYDPADPVTIASKGRLPNRYTDALTHKGLEGARIGVLRELLDTPTTDIDIAALMEQAIADIKKLGAQVVDPVVIPNFKQLTSATGFCSRFRYDINQYFRSLSDEPTVLTLKDIVASKRYHESSESGMKWAMSVDVAPEKQKTPCVDVQGDPRRLALLNAVVGTMEQHQLDALIYPSWNNPPRQLGDLDSPHGNNSPIIAPHSGQPAITVPMGFTDEGLPAGLQILGKPFSEFNLFKFAYAYEQATRHRKPPQLFE